MPKADLDNEGILENLQTGDLEPEEILTFMQEVVRVRNLLFKKEKTTPKKK